MRVDNMHPSSKRGNNPELWGKLLDLLDDKLQLGLLDHLKRVTSYHFEDSIFTVQPERKSDYEYLSKSSVSQQLTIFVKDLCDCSKMIVNKPTNS